MLISFDSLSRSLCYFVRSTQDPVTFQKGSPLHLFFLALAFFLAAALVLLRKHLRAPLARKRLRRIIGILLLFQQIALYGWYIGAGTFHWYVSLPLYNCRIATICIIVALFTPWTFPRIVGCYWGLGGALGALLLPDIDPYIFPHLTTLVFFGGHTLLLLGALYFITIEGFWPNRVSLKKILIFTNMYHIIVYGVNHLTGGNYCYLMAPPFQAAFFDKLQRFHLYLIFVMMVFNLAMLLIHRALQWASKKSFPSTICLP